ncbi:MAG TPA: carboxypeptidase-like regulatory domain-containing protein [Actinomycetes bacterium]|jgi:hypothetical protein|nr:carboxypeptidase-like regulatory domain-containing protein [Actinomycetes bacterium]
MPTLTGIIRAANQPAQWAYVQVRSPAGDFQGEVRADADGRFTLYPGPGRWRLVVWAPGLGRTERDLDVGLADLDVDLELSGSPEGGGG